MSGSQGDPRRSPCTRRVTARAATARKDTEHAGVEPELRMNRRAGRLAPQDRSRGARERSVLMEYDVQHNVLCDMNRIEARFDDAYRGRA